MQIEQRSISTIRPYENNPRQNDDAVAAVAESIRQFGFRVPIVVDRDGVIIAGHTRLKAALKLGMTEVPVHVAADLTPDQVRALRIADNKVGELAEWDLEKLTIELNALQASDPDLDLAAFGFDQDELAKLLDPGAADGLTDPNDSPEVPVEAVTKPGDLWILGKHKLLCGDSTKAESYAALMGDEHAHLLLTDPPYNVAYQGGTDEKLTIANDDMDVASYKKFLVDAFQGAAAVLMVGGGFYIWHADTYGGIVRSACDEVELPVRQCLIWKKSSLVLGRQDYQWIHEPCLYGWKPGAAHRWLGDRSQTTVLEHDKPKRNGEHPTMKPVELLTKLIANSSAAGDIVLDPFGGSGSTMIACEQSKRASRLIELDPRYCDVIKTRWENFTGQKAVLLHNERATPTEVEVAQMVGAS